MRLVCLLLVIASAASVLGCASDPSDSAFTTTREQARLALQEMWDEPKRLPRPLVVVGGFLDPNITTPLAAKFFRSITRDTTVITISIGTCGSFEDCRGAIIAAVDKNCPSADPQWTSEVDVVGFSLGGLAARYAAAPSRDVKQAKRLKIARLFTISSPHTGAVLAEHITLTQFHRDMRPGSEFLAYVAQNDASARYQLYPYVHLNDEMVGADHAAPAGTNPLWLPNPPFAPAHFSAMTDERILADIGRRLRGEVPLSHPPAAPLPE